MRRPAMSAKRENWKSASLFDHLVGGSQQRRGHRKAETLRGFQVDRQLVLRRRLHGKIGRPFTFEDAIDIGGGARMNIDGVRAIGSQTTSRRIVWKWINRRQ